MCLLLCLRDCYRHLHNENTGLATKQLAKCTLAACIYQNEKNTFSHVNIHHENDNVFPKVLLIMGMFSNHKLPARHVLFTRGMLTEKLNVSGFAKPRASAIALPQISDHR